MLGTVWFMSESLFRKYSQAKLCSEKINFQRNEVSLVDNYFFNRSKYNFGFKLSRLVTWKLISYPLLRWIFFYFCILNWPSTRENRKNFRWFIVFQRRKAPNCQSSFGNVINYAKTRVHVHVFDAKNNLKILVKVSKLIMASPFIQKNYLCIVNIESIILTYAELISENLKTDLGQRVWRLLQKQRSMSVLSNW